MVQGGCGVITLPVIPRRAGVEARPYEASDEVCAWNRRRRSTGERRTEDGASYDVWESISVKPTSSVIRRKGRRGRRPLRWLRVGMFQRSRNVQFAAPVTLHAASPVSHSPVGYTVLGAPRLWDCRATLDAAVRADRFCPCFPRCADLASTTQRIISRGHSPRTIGRREGTAPAVSYAATFVSRPP